MPGTQAGGKAAARTNKRKYGKDFYARIGQKGGAISRHGGFWYMKHVTGDTEAIKAAGRKGGRKSRRSKSAS